MENQKKRSARRSWIVVNYLALLLMNLLFYVVHHLRDVSHLVDFFGLFALLVVGLTFIRVHKRTGLWKLTHSSVDALDEREVQLTHMALRRSYAWFTVICLSIVLLHAVLARMIPGVDLSITVPLSGSLIYLAHTLPASVLAWTQAEVPGEQKEGAGEQA